MPSGRDHPFGASLRTHASAMTCWQVRVWIPRLELDTRRKARPHLRWIRTRRAVTALTTTRAPFGKNADILILIDLQQGAHNFARTVVPSELGAAQMPGPGEYGQGWVLRATQRYIVPIARPPWAPEIRQRSAKQSQESSVSRRRRRMMPSQLGSSVLENR